MGDSVELGGAGGGVALRDSSVGLDGDASLALVIICNRSKHQTEAA